MLCFTFVFEDKFPRGAYIRRGDLTEGFLRFDFRGLIFGGAYFFTVCFHEFVRVKKKNFITSRNFVLVTKHFDAEDNLPLTTAVMDFVRCLGSVQ